MAIVRSHSWCPEGSEGVNLLVALSRRGADDVDARSNGRGGNGMPAFDVSINVHGHARAASANLFTIDAIFARRQRSKKKGPCYHRRIGVTAALSTVAKAIVNYFISKSCDSQRVVQK